MRRAGFVLVGGRSSRMGRDKALLPFRGTTLAAYAASQVLEAAGSAVLVGDPARYGHLGYAVIPDLLPGHGPLGGLLTVLAGSSADWNLVAACDMPSLSAARLRPLLEAAGGLERGCVALVTDRGAQPLCAAYHRSCLEAVARAVAEKRLKMKDILGELHPMFLAADALDNVNTPEEWSAYEAAP